MFDATETTGLGARLQDAIENAFDDAYTAESRLTEALGKSPSDWLRDTFFRYYHNRSYSRRGQRVPLYWHLESESGAFSCYLYYQALDAGTFPKLRGQYIDARLDWLGRRIDTLEARPADQRSTDERAELEQLQTDREEIEAFAQQVDALIDAGFDPDPHAGIHSTLETVDSFGLLQTDLDSL
jgi:hypothetical protein